MPLDTPVVLILYNRPELLRQVFAAVATARPRRLFLVADGPKDEADISRCSDARAVVECVDWQCDVSRNFADVNLGVMSRLPTGLDWVFEQVSEAIVLEDDCVPAPSFFTFCEEMLSRYREDERVMEIGGSNLQLGRRRSATSYYFSGYCCVYGWATWRRAWRHFDLHIRSWPKWKEEGLLESTCADPIEVDYWREKLDAVHEGRLTTAWDYQWQLALWSQHGLSATPEVNLVSNIGFGPEASNTIRIGALEANLPRGELQAIEHAKLVLRHREADRFLFDAIIGGRRSRGLPALLRRVYAKMCRIGFVRR